MTLTPEQFNKLVTVDQFNDLKSDVKEVNDGVKQLISAVDGLTKIAVDTQQAFVSNQAAHDRFEKRIERIEKHLSLNPLFDY